MLAWYSLINICNINVPQTEAAHSIQPWSTEYRIAFICTAHQNNNYKWEHQWTHELQVYQLVEKRCHPGTIGRMLLFEKLLYNFYLSPHLLQSTTPS